MTANSDKGGQQMEEQSFVSHLLELRDRLLRMLAAVLVLFLAMFPFANDLYGILAGPLIRHLPEGSSMIATRVISPFLTPLKLTFVMAVILAVPLLLHQLWAFVAPGLYRHERRLALPLIASSVFLFYLGMTFAYFVVFPLLFQILPGMAPEQITVAPDIADYLDFVLTMFFAFGIAFEVPIAVILLVWMGVTTPQALREQRPYVIVGAFTIGMLLTPPDVISQTLLAIPMCILFELGVFFSHAFAREAGDDPGRDGVGDRQAAVGEPPAAPTAEASAVVEPEAEQPPVRTPRRQLAEFTPLSEAELRAQMAHIGAGEAQGAEVSEQAADAGAAASAGASDAVHAKLEQVGVYRDQQDEDNARRLLYEVLAEGDEDQVQVARNILSQLDDQC